MNGSAVTAIVTSDRGLVGLLGLVGQVRIEPTTEGL